MTSSASQACAEIPPVVANGYNAKGTYETHESISCYVTGLRDATKAIFFIYDIFGFQSQTIQGADILGSAGYLVVMPDFWEGKPAQPTWYARDTEEKKEALATFRERTNDTDKYIKMLKGVLSSLQSSFTHAENWGSIGYCWGGNIATLTSGPESPWKAAVETSPSRAEAEDGDIVSIPFESLLSKDEDRNLFDAKHVRIKGPKLLEVFDTQIHGWMSARANLDDPQVRSEYERGYRMALEWFAKYL